MKNLQILVAFFALVTAGSVANAATCPEGGVSGTFTRSFSLDAASGTTATTSCFAYGEVDVAGNIGNGTNDPILDGSTDWTLVGTAISGLEEIDDSGDGGLTYLSGNLASGDSGQVSVAASITSSFENLLVGFKFGRHNQSSPDWALFSISGPGTFDWSQTATQGALSHTILYGTRIAPVPLPAAGLLLLGALGGIAGMSRRKRSKV